ncbi:MAG: calcium-binding protein, partial [Actinomycetota bacterium]
GKAGHDRICGGDGQDGISGREGDDRLAGDAGNDQLHGLDGADLLLGGSGDDELYGGKGPDGIAGGHGEDEIFGDGGDDPDLFGGEGMDMISGGPGDDDLEGGDQRDELVSGAGEDFAKGNEGNDDLHGDVGHDTLFGGSGEDGLSGGDGPDEMFGGGAADVCFGGRGTDLCDGGPPGDPVRNTLSDPDICDKTVERKRSCHKGDVPAKWVGTVTGQQTGGGVTDEWTAQVTFELTNEDPNDPALSGGYRYRPTGSVTYQTSGGFTPCTYSGSGTLAIGPEDGVLDFSEDLTLYRGHGALTGPGSSYPITITCPDGSFSGQGPVYGTGWFSTATNGDPSDYESTTPGATTISGTGSGAPQGAQATYRWNFEARP